MKKCGLLLLFCGWQVQAEPDAAYQQCLLQYQSKVEVAEVVSLVRTACDNIHRGGVMLPRKRAYWQCVLDYVVPVKTAGVVRDLLDACQEQHNFKNSS